MAQDDDDFSYGGKRYPQSPGFVDSVKEGFLPMEQRAQIEAIRRTRSKPTKTFSSNMPVKSDE